MPWGHVEIRGNLICRRNAFQGVGPFSAGVVWGVLQGCGL